MKQTINFDDFCDAFRNMDRNNSFSYEGKKALFEYLEEYEENCGIEIELDVIALCCEYEENDYQYIADNYDIDLTDCQNGTDKIETVRSYLEEHTFLIGETEPGSLLYQVF